MSTRRIALVVLTVLFFFGESHVLPFVENLVPEIKVVSIVEEKPEQKYIDETKKIAQLITDKEDRIDLCLVNLEFSKRAEGYLNRSITGQQLNDLYVAVHQDYFKGRLLGKYEGLSSGTIDMLKGIVSEEESLLSKDQLRLLNRYLLALSWNLENYSKD